jgi:hypothetical protein
VKEDFTSLREDVRSSRNHLRSCALHGKQVHEEDGFAQRFFISFAFPATSFTIERFAACQKQAPADNSSSQRSFYPEGIGKRQLPHPRALTSPDAVLDETGILTESSGQEGIGKGSCKSLEYRGAYS